MEFVFRNPKTNETKSVDLCDDFIREHMQDYAYEKLTACDCEPIGETNVIDCNCHEEFEEFVLAES